MTTDVELLPLYAELQGHPKLEIVKHYARANVLHHIAARDAEIEALRAEVGRLMAIAGWGGLAGDAPERIILASEMFDGLRTCDKWLDVRRVIDDGKPLPESATAYVRADRAERLAEALREALALARDGAAEVNGATDYMPAGKAFDITKQRAVELFNRLAELEARAALEQENDDA